MRAVHDPLLREFWDWLRPAVRPGPRPSHRPADEQGPRPAAAPVHPRRPHRPPPTRRPLGASPPSTPSRRRRGEAAATHTAANTVDMPAVLDGGILLARLPKGSLGDEGTRLVGSIVVAQAWAAATARAAIPQQQRRDAALVIDECHNFLNLPYGIAEILAEARGLRLSLTLAHQNLAQLPRELREGISSQRPQQDLLHRRPGRRPRPGPPHPPPTGRARPRPPRRLPRRRPPGQPRRRNPRVHPAHPTPPAPTAPSPAAGPTTSTDLDQPAPPAAGHTRPDGDSTCPPAGAPAASRAESPAGTQAICRAAARRAASPSARVGDCRSTVQHRSRSRIPDELVGPTSAARAAHPDHPHPGPRSALSADHHARARPAAHPPRPVADPDAARTPRPDHRHGHHDGVPVGALGPPTPARALPVGRHRPLPTPDRARLRGHALRARRRRRRRPRRRRRHHRQARWATAATTCSPSRTATPSPTPSPSTTSSPTSSATPITATDDVRLVAWWSETRCARYVGDLARPDAYGRITLPQQPDATAPAVALARPRAARSGRRSFEWFFELDFGTEPLPRLAAKLDGYTQLAAATAVDDPGVDLAAQPATRSRRPRGPRPRPAPPRPPRPGPHRDHQPAHPPTRPTPARASDRAAADARSPIAHHGWIASGPGRPARHRSDRGRSTSPSRPIGARDRRPRWLAALAGRCGRRAPTTPTPPGRPRRRRAGRNGSHPRRARPGTVELPAPRPDPARHRHVQPRHRRPRQPAAVSPPPPACAAGRSVRPARHRLGRRGIVARAGRRT